MTKKQDHCVNPDPSRFVVRKRRDGYLLVDKQIARWESRRRKLRALAKHAEQEYEIADPRDVLDNKLFSSD